jgi:hypothetical protein
MDQLFWGRFGDLFAIARAMGSNRAGKESLEQVEGLFIGRSES